MFLLPAHTFAPPTPRVFSPSLAPLASPLRISPVHKHITDTAEKGSVLITNGSDTISPDDDGDDDVEGGEGGEGGHDGCADGGGPGSHTGRVLSNYDLLLHAGVSIAGGGGDGGDGGDGSGSTGHDSSAGVGGLGEAMDAGLGLDGSRSSSAHGQKRGPGPVSVPGPGDGDGAGTGQGSAKRVRRHT